MDFHTLEPDYQFLYEQAQIAQKRAYAPYSNFQVGAALQGADGRVYYGCNIENQSYGLTCCAERVAIFNAIANGCRNFLALAIAGPNPITTPCGACRQVLAEFSKDIPIIMGKDANGTLVVHTVAELLPYAFKLDHETE